ncbi:alpha/beta fold hydrolase [Nonomuraea sp. NPDC026600]|uniref:alpha/beta fold hydrolase n=1 Tax=Nonomuraea sp. NPDC026600 TaxID=3155363 RepID=UPI0033F72FD1
MRQPAVPRTVDRLPPHDLRFLPLPTGGRLAYATIGHGPPLVVPAAWIGHLELMWQDPAVRGFYAPLARRRTVVLYDKPGCGLSDPPPGRQTLDTDLDVLATLADHLALERFDLLGISMGAPVSVAFAARWGARVERLVLYGGYAVGGRIASPELRAAVMDLVRAHWGLGSDVLADIFLPDGSAETKAWFAELQRGATSAEVACQLLDQCYRNDVDDLVEGVLTPTLVLHRRDDRAIPYRLGRELAARIPSARLVTLSGRSHFPHAGDAQALVHAILDFLGEPGEAPRPSPGHPLTPRQAQVAALVAEGLTNRQIAGRLGIQERSAEGHVERIRVRLGFRSRAQVAVWWAQADGEVPLR